MSPVTSSPMIKNYIKNRMIHGFMWKFYDDEYNDLLGTSRKFYENEYKDFLKRSDSPQGYNEGSVESYEDEYDDFLGARNFANSPKKRQEILRRRSEIDQPECLEETRKLLELYLSQYGYLGPVKANSSQLLDESSFRKAVEDFQSFAGLTVTGELDDQTMETMQLPRCGVKDKVGTGDNRAKRYALQGSRWKVKNLSYKISKYPPKLKRKEVDAEVQRAFNVWSGYTDLSFTPKSGQVHIEIRFETGEHGDGDPFDGPGGTLAHAYFPPRDQQYLTTSPHINFPFSQGFRQRFFGVGRQFQPWFSLGPWFQTPSYTPTFHPQNPAAHPGKVSVLCAFHCCCCCCCGSIWSRGSICSSWHSFIQLMSAINGKPQLAVGEFRELNEWLLQRFLEATPTLMPLKAGRSTATEGRICSKWPLMSLGTLWV
ncbi:hypothetical protein HUJ04_005632 [Dendroctonus ponderosae]|nr:hypothetical protein HUJ04_005632 [Dendroctonus ponderosae]